MHRDIRACAAACPPHLALDVLLDGEKRITHVFAGELFAMHAAACETALAVAMRPVPRAVRRRRHDGLRLPARPEPVPGGEGPGGRGAGGRATAARSCWPRSAPTACPTTAPSPTCCAPRDVACRACDAMLRQPGFSRARPVAGAGAGAHPGQGARAAALRRASADGRSASGAPRARGGRGRTAIRAALADARQRRAGVLPARRARRPSRTSRPERPRAASDGGRASRARRRRSARQVGAQAVRAGERARPRAPAPGGRHPEGVARALDDEHRQRDGLQLGQARSPVVAGPARAAETPGTARRPRPPRPRSGRPRGRRTSGRRRRAAGPRAPGRGARRDHGEPGGVELPGGRRRAAPGDAVGLLHEGHRDGLVQRGPRRGLQVAARPPRRRRRGRARARRGRARPARSSTRAGPCGVSISISARRACATHRDLAQALGHRRRLGHHRREVARVHDEQRMVVCAVTVAVRRSVSTSAISPKKSPGPSVASVSSPRVTTASPESMTKNSCAKVPSLASVLARADVDLVQVARHRLALLLGERREQRVRRRARVPARRCLLEPGAGR